MVAAAVTVGELLAADLGLEATVVTAGAGSGRVISAPRIQKPGLALTGWDEQLHDGRLLILGGTEVAYLSGCDAPARALAVATMLKSVPAAVMIARGLAAPPELIAACDAVGVPVVASALITSDLIVRVTGWLAERMAPQTSIHGVLLDVLGIGILLLGPSGIGKSETALDLVVRGHRLVADDIVIIRKKAGFVFGSGSGIIRHHMEIRGLGIINIKDLFGVAAIREAKKVELVVELVEWDANEEYDRLGLDDTRYTVLDVQVPMVRLPVRPGRNLSTIIEVAARNQLLKFQGHHSAREFQERLNQAIAEARPARGFDVDVIE
ncbi:MAG: HPr(Ser) kinase/phosphatase [Myxococcales bacterium]|jgi:HPr kinase/phosphorylase|nr:HPr(Ser) kinase/phosphatase [Myxococcales bacterium]MBK7198069.1 HPr(Ser) kinase/phosphatase [Myxococcales bacterium]MBP6849328.1 HPr(Ser) kinase/phosphatase [Kofleriaceae bacterium]